MSSSQKQRGEFLTNDQREYLKGNHNPETDNAECQTRYRIRQRAIGAILDLQLLQDSMPKEDKLMVAEELGQDVDFRQLFE